MYVYIIDNCNIGDDGCLQIGKCMNNLTKLILSILFYYKYRQ